MTRARIVLLVFFLVACGKKPPAQPTPAPVHEASAGSCPSQMWQPGEKRPGGIQVENRSGDSVIVFLVRCQGSTRVGDLGPGETNVLALPNGALNYSGLIRFRTYRGPLRLFALELAQPVGDPYLRLIIPEQARAECPEIWIDGKKSESHLDRIPREQIANIEYVPTGPGGECSRIMVTLKRANG
jgi:hypothetical protein